MTSPLNTDVMANETPVTVPTSPLARSRRSAGTSSVTQVDSAMLRSWPATDPANVRAMRIQNHGRPRSSRLSASTSRNSTVAATKHSADVVVATTIARCLRWWSTNVPNQGPSNADDRPNAAPMTPVATTERVPR